MAADGVQATLDAAVYGVALVGFSIAARPPDEEHHDGHQRYETLVSLGIAAMMTFGAVEIVQQAVHRLQSGSSPDLTFGSFVVTLATMSVCVGVSL